MREQRLLERLKSWENEPGRRTREDSGRIINSVLSHLQRVLNTKMGNVQIADDFGLPDFTDLIYNYPEAVRGLERSIQVMIQKYEPRLRLVRVRFVPQEDARLALDFQITAEIDNENEKIPVLFESQMDTNGRVKIKG
ncbi:MAG: type VI secretion system baseplate subunit TssE [Proteobacteria bacterium]|nr:type VI secretion system baseplate subunit TssE [Pseudomonadota bacterium]